MSPSDQIKLAQQRRGRPDLDGPLVATPGKRCKDCLYPVPLWYMNGPRCKPCAAMKRQAAHRERTYGLDDDGHGGLLRLQGGRCAICRKAQQVKALAVDHNHQTGKVRGLLCQNCNHAILGSGFDSARLLFAAAAYLMCPPADGAWVPPERLDAAMAAFRTAYVETAAAQA
jgi:hypothetical protein